VKNKNNNNNNNNNNKANNKKQQQNDRKHHADKQTDGFKFVVTGFQAETSAQELVAFVTSSAAVKLNLVETGFNPDGSFYLVVDTTRESAAIAKLSSRQFNGSRLIIKQVFNPHASNKLVQLLSSYVEANYDASFGYLDLSALKRGIPSVPIDLNNSNTTKTLFAVIKEKCPDVQTLNLASNRIHSLYALSHLRQSAPNVINLSLEDNNVSDFRQLDHLKALPLRELMLRNNPIAVDAVAYRTAVSTRVPRLKILDTQEIAPLIQFNVQRDADAFAMPELRASYADSDAFFAYDFVRRFLAFYDTGQRAQLDHLYAENSLFSLTTTLQPSIVRERPRRGAASTTVPTDTAGIYIGASRNLVTSVAASSSDAAHASTSSSSARDRVQRGRINILHQLLQLPASTHDVDTLVIDAYVVREALVLVSVHGFFLENDSGEVHSFSRTFTLTPAPADSGAMLQGWPVIVLNDQLCVRPAPQRRHFTPVATGAAAGAAITVLPTTQVALGPAVSQSFGMQLPQSLTFGRPFAAAAAAATTAASTTLSPDALQKLIYVTSLKPQFAQQILDATGWNYEAALQQFLNLKKTKQLPPDALSSH
jgi:nuclear RNA export factor